MKRILGITLLAGQLACAGSSATEDTTASGTAGSNTSSSSSSSASAASSSGSLPGSTSSGAPSSSATSGGSTGSSAGASSGGGGMSSSSLSSSSTSGGTGSSGDPGPWAPPGTVLCAAGDTRCGAPFDPANGMETAALEDALSRGMAAWRFHGTRGACASCHTPDALDLAMGGFSDDNIRRRAMDHVNPMLAEDIVGLVHAVRQKHHLTALFHPAALRPLQPGFEPFHETTPNLPVWTPPGSANATPRS